MAHQLSDGQFILFARIDLFYSMLLTESDGTILAQQVLMENGYPSDYIITENDGKISVLLTSKYGIYYSYQYDPESAALRLQNRLM